MTQGTVLIAGALGNFGGSAATAFAAADWTVRRYRRGTDMAAAAQGADVIVNGLNPPLYHDWDALIPAITGQAIAAARASGATLLVPGTVYVYGQEPGPWSEATPHRFVARKGRIRAEMEASYRQAAAAGVRVILLRSGDFIDPGNPNTLLEMIVLKGLPRGFMMPTGRPAARRAYAYLPDLARAAVALAEMRAALAPYQEVNLPGLTFSMQELRAEIARQTGRRPWLLPFPWPLLRLAAPFHELSRELLEMRYLHDLPHSLAGERFHRLLPEFATTSFAEVVARQLAALAAGKRGQVGDARAA